MKVANGDELYSVTAVYVSREVKGRIKIDGEESVEVRYFALDELPKGLIESYRRYIGPYIEQLAKS